MRPAGEVTVDVPATALKSVVHVLPLTFVCQVSVWSVNGFAGSARVMARVLELVRVTPAGVRMVDAATIGACMPNRGSGPVVMLVTVPSCWVVLTDPSLARTVVVLSPAGSVSTWFSTPLAS